MNPSSDQENHWKIIQKSSKDHKKFKTSIKNQSRSALERQEAPRPPQEPPRSLRSPKTGAMDPPSVRFGRLLEPRSLPGATRRPLKRHTKFPLIAISILHWFWKCFVRVLEAMLASKLHHKSISNFEWFFDRFLSIFTGNWPPQNLNFSVSLRRESKNHFFPCFL